MRGKKKSPTIFSCTHDFIVQTLYFLQLLSTNVTLMTLDNEKHNINYFNFLQLRFIEIGKNLCNIIIYLTLNTIEQIKMFTIIQSSTKSSSWARK